MKKFKRILALIGAILLVALYGSTLVFALQKSPNSDNLLKAAIACTLLLPILLYAITLVSKHTNKKDWDDSDTSKP